MYAYDDPQMVLGNLGAAQSGVLPVGSRIWLAAGTVLIVREDKFGGGPTRPVVLSSASEAQVDDLVAVTGDVVGRDLVSAGGVVTLDADVRIGGDIRFALKLDRSKSWSIVVQKGAQVTYLGGPVIMVDDWGPPPVSDCPAGKHKDASGACVPVASAPAVPWYKRGSTYAVAGGVLLLVVIVVAIARKG